MANLASESTPPRRLFASYSRRDGRHVAQIVQLLRVTGAPVFRDQENIAPGKRWRTEISDALASADTVLLFWSRNAHDSSEVRAEYEHAISLGKDVVPVLLDDAPLAGQLREFQYIDFSELFLPHDSAGVAAHGRELTSALLQRIFATSPPSP